jgi:hypothetical protein
MYLYFDFGTSQFDHIVSSQSREKILVKRTRGPQNDSRGHKNIVEKIILNVWIENGPIELPFRSNISICNNLFVRSLSPPKPEGQA